MKSTKWPPHRNNFSKIKTTTKRFPPLPQASIKQGDFRVFARKREEQIDSPVSCNNSEQLKAPSAHFLNFKFDLIVRREVEVLKRSHPCIYMLIKRKLHWSRDPDFSEGELRTSLLDPTGSKR